METRELRKLLSMRLDIELELFKDFKLRQEKEDIYKSSYEIEIYVNLYEILVNSLEHMQKDIIHKLLNLRYGILEFLYREWLTKEDGFFNELHSYVCSELERVSDQWDRSSKKSDE